MPVTARYFSTLGRTAARALEAVWWRGRCATSGQADDVDQAATAPTPRSGSRRLTWPKEVRASASPRRRAASLAHWIHFRIKDGKIDELSGDRADHLEQLPRDRRTSAPSRPR